MARNNLLVHSYVITELSLGWLRQRTRTLALLESLPDAPIARPDEVRQLIESRALYGRGVGLVDLHLLASAFLQTDCLLWTLDKRLKAVALELGVLADLP